MEDATFMVDLDDMNDLFVDDQPVPAQADSQAQPEEDKPLLTRLEELYLTNSCQKLAWSRLGALAAVSADCHSVKVHVYAREPESDEGSLYAIKPSTIILPSSPHQIAHVTWDPTGSILVVVDSIGGTCVYTTIICLNRFDNYSLYDCPSEDATATVVGFDWFEPLRQSGYYHVAHRVGDSWKFDAVTTRPYGPTHPMQQKQAGLIVSRAGALRLIFGQPDYAFGYARAMLEGITSAEQLITHAAMAPDHSNMEQKMILATHDFSHTIRLYYVSVDWRLPQQHKGKPGQPNIPPGFRFDPKLISQPLTFATIDGCESYGTSSQLSHLQILPETDPDGNARTPSPPIVLAVMTVVTKMSFPISQNVVERHSRLVRWELIENVEDIQQAFDHLSGNRVKNNKTSPESRKALNRLPDVDITSVVVATTFSQSLNQLILTRSDGIIEFRWRDSLELVEVDQNSSHIRSPQQAGLQFQASGPLIHSALSANYCMAACKGEDEEQITIKLLTDGVSPSASEKDVDAMMASLVLAFASSTLQNKNNEDTHANLQRLLRTGKISTSAILSSIFRSVDLNVDFLAETLETDQEPVNRLLFQSHLTRCLSFQQALHTNPEGPSAAAQVANIMLNVRFGILSIQFAQRSMGSPQEGATDTAASILGVIQYLLTLILYLAGEILDLNRIAPPTISKEWAQTRIDDFRSPILPLLASAPRFLIRFSCRCLRTMIDRARASKDKQGNPHRKSWTAIADITNSCGISLKSFETLLLELDHHARQAYTNAGIGEKERAEIELNCIVSGTIPERLMPVVQRLVTTCAAKLAAEKECDPMTLFFADVSAMKLADDYKTGKTHDMKHTYKRCRHENTWDVIRKTPLNLARARTWRRCSRCCSVMEDMSFRLCSQWVMGMQKNCVCGSAWVVDGIESGGEGKRD